MENKQKMEELKGTEEGKKFKEDVAWDTMLKRAQGVKVKDDPKKLKKSIKREEGKKKEIKEKLG